MHLHLTGYVQGARKPINPHAHGVPAADLSEVDPPDDADFTEREIAAVIRPNKIGYVVTGTTRPKKVESALRGLVALGHGADIANRLILSARADAAMITQLLQQGVDRLDFGLILPSTEADEVVGEQPLSLAESVGRAVGRELHTRITADLDPEDVDLLEDMNARLRLKLRKRNPTVEQIENLTAIAAHAIEDDDEEFRIRTRRKVEFSREKLLLKSVFEHPDNPTTLQYELAWNETIQFLNQT